MVAPLVNRAGAAARGHAARRAVVARRAVAAPPGPADDRGRAVRDLTATRVVARLPVTVATTAVPDQGGVVLSAAPRDR